jgi:hypothetical protein
MPKRWSIPVLILALSAGAQEQDLDKAELLKLARQGMEARLKVGDGLRRQGDVKGALEAYREATRRFQEALDLVAPRKAPAGDVVGIGGVDGATRVRALRARRAGGTGRTENAVALGLKWLAAHQDVDLDGRWDADGFMRHDPGNDRCTGPGGARYDVGVTGLALLAFLGAGYTDRGSSKQNVYGKNVRLALRFLMASQTGDGCFGPRSSPQFIYNHAIATLALCEAYWMTHNPRYKGSTEAGLKFLMRARNPYMAWRYGVRPGDNDTSVTGWAVMALKSGAYAGLEIDPGALAGARQWIDKATDPNTGQVGYNYPGGSVARPEGLVDRFPAERSQAMTASAIMIRVLTGEHPTSEVIAKGAALCLNRSPRWDPTDGSIDMYYWFWGTLALFQIGGDAWVRWNEALKEAAIGQQHLEGSRAGSWDPVGPWGIQDGGRVYSTALMTMCLEVYYRYARLHGRRLGAERPR